MDNNIVSIKLNPIKDGIVSKNYKVQSTSGRYVIVGTDFNYKTISENEFYGFIKEMGENAVQMLYEDYLIIYDKRHAINISGEEYFIGSFLMAVPSEKKEMFEYLDDDDIERFMESISGAFTELCVNGDMYEALVLI